MENEYELYDCLGCSNNNGNVSARKTGQSSVSNISLSESNTLGNYSEKNKNYIEEKTINKTIKKTNHEMSTNIFF